MSLTLSQTELEAHRAGDPFPCVHERSVTSYWAKVKPVPAGCPVPWCHPTWTCGLVLVPEPVEPPQRGAERKIDDFDDFSAHETAGQSVAEKPPIRDTTADRARKQRMRMMDKRAAEKVARLAAAEEAERLRQEHLAREALLPAESRDFPELEVVPPVLVERAAPKPRPKRLREGDTSYRKFKGDRCVRCAFLARFSIQLHVDHIDGNHGNNDPENLQTLCANCHAEKTHLQRLAAKQS